MDINGNVISIDDGLDVKLNTVPDSQGYDQIKRKKVCIFRYGGLGDIMSLIPVAKQLYYKKGYVVDLCVGSPTGKVKDLFSNLDYISNVFELGVLPHLGHHQCVEDENKNIVTKAIFKDGYDEVYDLMYSVEMNKPPDVPGGKWRDSINSNYQNWVDLSLSWCNIDPSTVLDENKRPELGIPKIIYQDHVDYINSIAPYILSRKKEQLVIGIQLQASTLIRTWYKAADLPSIVHLEYPDAIVLIYTDNGWFVISKNGNTPLKISSEMNPLIISTIFIQNMDCFISADSGFSHVAEAVCSKNITIYTTVPSWTRAKYYKYCYPIDSGVPCSPCFTLGYFCPIKEQQAKESLTDREKMIIKAAESGENIHDVAKKLNSIPGAIHSEFQTANQRRLALSAEEADCIKAITTDMILNKMKEVLVSL